MPRQSDEFEVYSYLDGSVIAGKWVLEHKVRGLRISSAKETDDREFWATYDEGQSLVLSIRLDGAVRHQKETGTILTSEENSSGARLLLELALYMLSAGALDPGDISDTLAPRVAR